jgi:AraC-like DNA-binding protein
MRYRARLRLGEGHVISYRPGAPLALYVDRLWWSHRAVASTTREHVLPSGKAQLVIALHGEPIAWSAGNRDEFHTWTAGVVHGPQASYFLSGPKPRGSVMGVSFRPGAAGALLGVPAEQLADRHVTIEELWGARGTDVRERLVNATTPEAAFMLLEEALVARLRHPLLLHPAVAHALRECTLGLPQKRVTQIQRETGYSAKHFIALFRSAVGLTPKQYLRIQRFENVLRTLAAGPPGTLCDVAVATGYADQSHLTREFRELAGITPREYRPQAPSREHHHVTADMAPGTALPK